LAIDETSVAAAWSMPGLTELPFGGAKIALNVAEVAAVGILTLAG
jgi:hypothetical protein